MVCRVQTRANLTRWFVFDILLLADFTVTLKRLVLRGMQLAPASGAGGLPRLLPLGLFPAVPRHLAFYDVRMVVEPNVFQEYLTFFRQQLRTTRETAGAGPSIHTVSKGSVLIAAAPVHCCKCC